MKKTLLICGRYPLPEDHGSPMRTMNFVRFLKNYGTVDIAYSGKSPGEQGGNPTFSNEYFLEKKDFPKNYKKRLLRLLNLKKIPLPISQYDDVSEKQLLLLIESKNYDYIFTRYLMNTSILFKLPKKYNKRTIIDFDDILSGSLYDSMYGAVQGWHKRMIVALNRLLLTNYERKCLHFGASLFCSERDRSQFAGKNGKVSMHVVPNIYANNTFEDFDFGEGFDKGNTLLFVGALGYGPNERSLRWFIETVFPRFRNRYVDGRLLVVGRSPDDEMRQVCASTAGVELHADVPDIKEYYKKCKAVIVPLLAGGGTRIKILEAALANRPVLSTPIGAEGLDLVDGNDLLLFHDSHDFTAQYSKLLNRDTYNSIVRNAKHLVLDKYSVQRFNEVMEEVLYALEHKNANTLRAI